MEHTRRASTCSKVEEGGRGSYESLIRISGRVPDLQEETQQHRYNVGAGRGL